jgi:hypothetical protein
MSTTVVFADAAVLSEDLSSLKFKLASMTLVNSPSSNRRRKLLSQAGDHNRIVVGYQVRYCLGLHSFPAQCVHCINNQR